MSPATAPRRRLAALHKPRRVNGPFSGSGEVRVIERLKPRRVDVMNAHHHDGRGEHERYDHAIGGDDDFHQHFPLRGKYLGQFLTVG
jgi:hypothetical protein